MESYESVLPNLSRLRPGRNSFAQSPNVDSNAAALMNVCVCVCVVSGSNSELAAGHATKASIPNPIMVQKLALGYLALSGID